jgi:nicotinate dehydrogenase subunit B
VVVKVLDGSGVFGRNLVSDVAVDAALLAQAVPGRPLRLQWMRDEEFAWSPYRSARILQYRGGLDGAGKVSAMDVLLYLPWRPLRGFRGENLIGSYAFQTARVRERRVLSPLRSGFVRGIWHLPNTFGLESFMDELAYAAQADPLEFRLRHLSDSRCSAVLKAAARAIGYTRHIGPSQRGIGLAVALYETESATTNVAHAAQVEVDKSSGAVQVKKLAVAQDCGLIINPELVRMQLESASIQASSWAIKESVQFNNQMVTSQDWNSYPILGFGEVPEISITLINRPRLPAKGVGEPATVTVAPAIANAIFDACGARVREMPFRPERVKAALEERR